MPDSKDLIAGLLAAVEAQPDNVALRLHLAGELMKSERAEDESIASGHPRPRRAPAK